MEKFYKGVVKHKTVIIIAFIFCSVLCFFLKNLVAVNYDMNEYLPSDAK